MVKKNIFITILFSFIILECNNESKNIELGRNEIVFWKYNESLTFDMLKNELGEVRTYFEPYVIIPLNTFDYYFWDEQILCMKYTVFENNYENKFFGLYSESDYGSIFFSIIINNKIVFSGLNRIMFISAQMMPYDGLEIPIVINQISNDKTNLYFRLTYFTDFGNSIHDYFPDKVPNYTEDELKHPEIGKIYISRLYGNLDSLFIPELYEYFLSIDKVICGRYNTRKLLNYNVLEKIDNTK